MANESVSVRFDAETSGYTAKVEAAAKSTDKLGQAAEKASRQGKGMGDGLGAGAEKATTKMGRLSQAVTKHSDEMQKVGTTMTVVGAALLAGAGLAAKAAMEWESAWAGVTKTVEGTDEELRNLESGLRQMARTLPASHTEIAAVAEAAGQLGVKTQDIEGFTRTMIDLGETTNLTADEAATSLAQFMNIMGTAGADVDNLGSALVQLGNNGASTEKDILNMSLRIAAVGKQMGMSEDEVMSLASAMSSVGIEAEAGGTAISMVMKKIDASVREGGDALQGWADAAGISAEEFATAWQNDPAQAMVTLTQHMGEVAANGGDVNKMLSDLGIKGVREADTMLRLAQSGDLLAQSFRDGAEGFSSASALADEASKRYQTSESRIRIAWNQIKDAGIDAGAAILPVIAGIAEGAGGLATAFGALPGPVKSTVGALAGIAGVGLLAGGALLKLVPAAFETWDAMKKIGLTGSKAMAAIKGLAVAGGVAIGLAAIGSALVDLWNSGQPAAASLEEVANAMLKVRESDGDIAAIDELFTFGTAAGDASININGMAEALDLLDLDTPAKHIQSFGDSVFGIDNATSKAREAFEKMDQLLSSMSIEEAGEQMNNLRLKMEAAGNFDLSNWESLKALMPEYAKSVEAAANATGQSTEAADLFQAAMGNLPPHMQEAAAAASEAEGGVGGLGDEMQKSAEEAEELQKAIDEAVSAIEGMGSEARTVSAAQDAFQASLMAVTDSIKENGKSLDNTTEKGLANREALRGIADAGTDAAARIAEFGGTQAEVKSALDGTYTGLVNAGKQFGLTAGEAEALAREMLGIPPGVDIDTWMDSYAMDVAEKTGAEIEAIPDGIHVIADMSDKAYQQAIKTGQGVKEIPGYKKVDVAVDDKGTPGQIQKRINAVTGKTEYVFVDDKGTVQTVQRQIMRINGKDVEVYVKDDGTIVMTQGRINQIRGKDVTINAIANVSAAEAALNRAARTRNATIIQNVTRRNMGQVAQAVGGLAGIGPYPKLPGYAMGRLPYTGRGTDRILGVNEEGWPVARVNDGEGIIREPMTRKHLPLLAAINDDNTAMIKRLVSRLPGHADGRLEPTRQWQGNPAAGAGIDYDRLGKSISLTNTQYITTNDPEAAAHMGAQNLKHALRGGLSL